MSVLLRVGAVYRTGDHDKLLILSESMGDFYGFWNGELCKWSSTGMGRGTPEGSTYWRPSDIIEELQP